MDSLDLRILYEDNHLIAIFKPSGILVQGDSSGDENLMDLTKRMLIERDNKPGNVFLGLIHRIDRPVSGIVLFAKTSKGAARISEQIRNREFKKIYCALVVGNMSPLSGVLKHRLLKDEARRMAIISEMGDEAILDYETIESVGNHSVLKINLITGRFHQIRAQLSAVGHPILGDVKYGASEVLPDRSIALCATEMEFISATGSKLVSIKIDPPLEFRQLAGV